MAKEKNVENNQPEVKHVTSLTLSVENGDKFDHLQFVVVREIESGNYRCFFDVVDVSKIKLQES